MKKLILVCAVLFFLVANTNAQIPQLINYQGKISDDVGPLNGSFEIKFIIYGSDTGSDEIWSETQTVSINDGFFTALLGTVQEIPLTVFDEEIRYLAMQVGTDPEMTPRKKLVSVGYSFRSFRASNADTLGGKSASGFVQQMNGVIPGLGGVLDLEAGANVTLTPDNTSHKITISATGGGSGGNTLDQAYDQGGAGAGRTITADAGAVTINGADGLAISGNVGIGITPHPVSKLHLSGGSDVTLDDGGFLIAGPTDHLNMAFDNNEIMVRRNGAPDHLYLQGYGGDIFIHKDAANEAQKIIIKDNGNIGIGIADPLTRLHLNGGGDVTLTEGGNLISGDASQINMVLDNNEIMVRNNGNPANLYLQSYGGDYVVHYNATSELQKFVVKDDGKVGIGTLAPTTQLYVNSENTAIHGEHGNGNYGEMATEQHGVFGRFNNGNYGYLGAQTVSVLGKHSNDNTGYLGGHAVGVYGSHYGGNYGQIADEDQGVYGKNSDGPSGFVAGHSRGVQGNYDDEGTHWGVLGSFNTGVYGKGDIYAGYFSGDVHVTGNLTPASSSVKMDHPLDPANKYLQHSNVISPDMMTIYNGNVILDASGQARVDLPEWFDALNKDFRYQLTAIAAPGPNLYVAEEISNNQFRIAGGSAGMKVSWQVTGVRKDAYAEAHRTRVEVEKQGEERGKYLHPIERGLAESLSIDSQTKVNSKVQN